MKTLYTNNYAGAFAATRDYIGSDATKQKEVKNILCHFCVGKVRELNPEQFAEYIGKLGREVFAY